MMHDTYALCGDVYNAFSPSTAQGAGLSSVVKINGIRRKTASYSTVDLRIVGQVGTIVTGRQGRGRGRAKMAFARSGRHSRRRRNYGHGHGRSHGRHPGRRRGNHQNRHADAGLADRKQSGGRNGGCSRGEGFGTARTSGHQYAIPSQTPLERPRGPSAGFPA